MKRPDLDRIALYLGRDDGSRINRANARRVARLRRRAEELRAEM